LATYVSPGNPNLAGTPFQPAAGVAGNLIDPVAAKLFALFPKPTVNATDFGTLQGSNFFSAGASSNSNNQFDIKIDHRFSDRDLLSVRYSQQKQSSTTLNAFGNFADPLTGGPGYFTNHDVVINHTHTFSPAVVLTVTYGYVRRFDNAPGIKGQFPNIESSFANLGIPSYLDSGFGTLPGIQISGYSTGNAGPNLGTAFFSITREGQDAHHLGGSVSWTRGKHELKFGGEGRLRRINHTNPGWSSGAFNFDSTATSSAAGVGGDSLASFLTGVGSLTNTGGGGCTPCQQGFNNVVSTQSFQIGTYAQDNYKITPKLTLNLGLRCEVNMPRTERFNRMNYVDPNALSPLQVPGLPTLHGIEVFLNSSHRHNYDTDYRNISPRFGLAYQLPHGFVVRGGYGIYFSTPRSGAAGTGPWGYEGYNIQPSWLTALNNDGVTPWNTLKNTDCLFTPPYNCGVALPPSTLRTFNAFNDIGYDAVGPIPKVSLNTPYGAQVRKDGEKRTLTLVRELRHSPGRVWQALADPETLREFAPFEADMGAPAPEETTVTRADAPKVLEYNDIRWELEAFGGGTRLTLWHNIDRRFISMGAAGWHIAFDVLDRLRSGTPIGRIVGGGAMKFGGWQRLNAEYAKQFGIETPNWPPNLAQDS
jgi:TonB dependent receptor